MIKQIRNWEKERTNNAATTVIMEGLERRVRRSDVVSLAQPHRPVK